MDFKKNELEDIKPPLKPTRRPKFVYCWFSRKNGFRVIWPKKNSNNSYI